MTMSQVSINSLEQLLNYFLKRQKENAHRGLNTTNTEDIARFEGKALAYENAASKTRELITSTAVLTGWSFRMVNRIKKVLKLFTIRPCEQCGKKYLQLFGVYQFCSNKCIDKSYEEMEEDLEAY